MGNNGKFNFKIKSNSAFAIAAGCAVAFMFIVTLISILLYRSKLNEVSVLLSDGEYESYDSYVVFITEDDTSDYWTSVYNAAKEQGAKEGIYVDMLSSSLNEQYTKAELFDMAIAAGVDGIIVEGDESAEMTALMQEADNADIPVVTMQTDVLDAKRASYIGVSSYSLASLYADELTKNILNADEDKVSEVYVLEGSELNESRAGILLTSIQEDIAQKDDISKYNFTRLAIEDNDTFSTEEYVQDLFQQEKLPDVIICLDELTTTCVYQALIDYNKVGQVRLLGYYESATILQGIKQGVIEASVSVDTEGMGMQVVDAFKEYMDTTYVSDYMVVNTELITRDNVDLYMREGDNE